MLMLLAVIALLGWLYLAFLHGQFWRPVLAAPAVMPNSWPSIDIIVPARNEAELLPGSLPSLLAQDYAGSWRIILVDDHSTDGTTQLAQRLAKTKGAEQHLLTISAPELPLGWTGKVHALHVGLQQSTADYVLFTDADIFHSPTNVRELVARAIENKLDLTSQMVKLHCQNFSEQLLIPAFVFFFSMLYPFRRVNDDASHVAAAAGGVMLLKRSALDAIGGLTRVRGAIIDDCALASEVKKNRGRIELTLAPEVRSLRMYPSINDIWRMIARTAFTQIDLSAAFLGVVIVGMFVFFVSPALIPVFGGVYATRTGLLAWMIMTMLYAPIVRFYGLSFVWALMLPAAALVYVAATIDSARLYWQGQGAQWKGRSGVGGS